MSRRAESCRSSVLRPRQSGPLRRASPFQSQRFSADSQNWRANSTVSNLDVRSQRSGCTAIHYINYCTTNIANHFINTIRKCNGNLETSNPQAMKNSVRKESPSLPPPSPYFARLEGFQIVNAICFVENLIYNLHNIVMWFEFAFQIIKNIILYQTL